MLKSENVEENSHEEITPSAGPSTPSTFVAVYAVFGLTLPGIYDKERGVYTPLYPVNYNPKLYNFNFNPHFKGYYLVFQFPLSIQTVAITEKLNYPWSFPMEQLQ
uniref:Uncharacterized protein n=1 Tax=Lactuca sativa TaxID=4236 RepID=A0A9R1W5Y4_LACSA|nr:hypothetical protein LSAT_V11C300135050 [Lactuca sativa]